MDNQVLTGIEARKALRHVETTGKCGYFEQQYIKGCPNVVGRWFVWDHRYDEEVRGVRLDSEEACKRWLQKG